jgi:methionyl aminopeptidase
MFVAGTLGRKAERLIQVTHDALMKGHRGGEAGQHVRRYRRTRFSAMSRRTACRWCAISAVTGWARVPRAAERAALRPPGREAMLEEGMFFTIEPMVNLGRPETKVLADDWTAVTRDKSLSAQFEHSVGVTANGCDIFTLSPAGRFHPTWG